MPVEILKEEDQDTLAPPPGEISILGEADFTPAPAPVAILQEAQDLHSPVSFVDIGDYGDDDQPGWFARTFDRFEQWNRERHEAFRKERGIEPITRDEARQLTKDNIKRNREMFSSRGGGQFSFGDTKPMPHSALVRAGLEEAPEDEVENALNEVLGFGDPERSGRPPAAGRLADERKDWARYPKDPNGFVIDPTRPLLQNEDGTRSTERTITVETDGRFFNIPTIVKGKVVPNETAIEHARMQAKKGWIYPNFATEGEALAAAPARSDSIMDARTAWEERPEPDPEDKETEAPKPEDPWFGGTGVLWGTLLNVPAMFKRQWGGAKMFLSAPRDLAYILEMAADQGVAPQDSFALEVEAYVQGIEPAEYYGNLLKQAENDVGLQEGMRINQEATKYLQDYAPNVNEDSVKYYTGAIIEGAINMAPALLATAATRSPTAGAALMGGQVFADQYAESIREGRSHSEAVSDGIVFAAAEVLTERIPLGALTKGGGTLLKRMLTAGGAEALQEPLTQLLQEAYTKGVITEEMTFGEALIWMTTTEEGIAMLRRSAIIGFGVGGTLATVSHPFYKDVTQEELDEDDPTTDDDGKPVKKPKAAPPSEQNQKISPEEAEEYGLSEVDVDVDLLERVAAGDPLTLDEQYTLTNNGYGKFFGPDDRIAMLPKGRTELKKLRDEAAGEEIVLEGDTVTTRKTGEVIDITAEKEPGVTRKTQRAAEGQEGDVTDQRGEKIIVWRGEHGLREDQDAEFQSRVGSLSFGSLETATNYAKEPNDRTRDRMATDPRVRGYTLNIKKPFVNSKDDPFIDLAEIRRKLGPAAVRRIVQDTELSNRIMNTNNWEENFAQEFESPAEVMEKAPERVDQLYMDLYSVLDDARLVQMMRKKGFDGAIHQGMGQNFDEIEYRVFDSAQAERLPTVEILMEEDQVSEREAFRSDVTESRSSISARLAAAERRVEPRPTEEQKKAGNYKKGHLVVDGLGISIENKKGGTRSGVDRDGKSWSIRMKDAYGYIKGTESRELDGYGGFDQVDAFIGRYPESGLAVVVNQKEDPSKPIGPNNFDEHKVMLGYRDVDEAIKAYRRNYSDGGRLLGDSVEMTTDELKTWLETGDTKSMVTEEMLIPKTEPAARVGERTNAGRGRTVEEIQDALRPIYRMFRTVPPVRVVESIEDLPKHLQVALDDEHSKRNTTGMYDQGAFKDDIYIVANNVTSNAEAIETLLHEVVGHFGLRQVIQPWAFDEIMDAVAKAFPKQVRNITQEYDLDWNNMAERRIAAEEYIAHTAQKVLAGEKVSVKAKRLLDRVVEALRNVIRWMTGQQQLMTTGQILSMISQSSDFVQRPGGYQRAKRRGRLRHVSAPYFYSAVWKAFNETDTKATSADGWKQFIKSQIKKGKMKQTEIDWMGLETWLDDATWGNMYQLVANRSYNQSSEFSDVEALFPKPMFEVFKEQRELGAENSATRERATALQSEAFEEAFPDVNKKIGHPDYNSEAATFRRDWLADKDNNAIQYLPVNEQRDLANNEDRHEELTHRLEEFGRTKPKKIPVTAVQSYIERNGVDIDVRNPGGDDEYGEPGFDESHPDEENDFDEDEWYEHWSTNYEEQYHGEYYDDALKEVFEEHNWDPDLEADPDVPEEEDMDIEELNEALGAWDGTSMDDMEEDARERATDALEQEHYSDARSEWETKHRDASWYSGQYTIRVDGDGDFAVFHDDEGDLGYNADFDSAVDIATEHYEGRTSAWKEYMLKPAGEDYEVLLFRWQNPDQEVFSETGHWENEDNFVAHVRFDIRKDPDGNDAIYIDEMQSDWHQAIRDAIQSKLSEVWADHGYAADYDNGDGTFGGGENYDGTPIAEMYEHARQFALENPAEVEKWRTKAQERFEVISRHQESVVEEMKEWTMNQNLATVLRSAMMGEDGASAAKEMLQGFDAKVTSIEGGASSVEAEREEQLRSFVYEEHGFVDGLDEPQNMLFSAYREMRRGEPGAQLNTGLISQEEFDYKVETRAKELGVRVQQFATEKMGAWRKWTADIWEGDTAGSQLASNVLSELAKSKITEVPEWDGTAMKAMDAEVRKQALAQLHDEAMTTKLKDLPPSVNQWQQVQDGTHVQDAWNENVDVLAKHSSGWESGSAMMLYSAFARLSKEMHKVSEQTQEADWQEEDRGFPQFTYVMNEKQVDGFEHGVLEFSEFKNKYQQYSDGHSFAPFEKDWQLLVIKHMIAEASRRGMSRIYFSKGEVHGVRWGGGETVSDVTFKKHPLPSEEQDPTPDLFTGELKQVKRGNEFTIELVTNGGQRHIMTTNTQLSKNVGQRVAKLILAAKNDEGTINHEDAGQRNIIIPSASVGQRLTGSRVIYNDVAVNQINKFLKKFKGKVKDTWVPGTVSVEDRERAEKEGVTTIGYGGPKYERWKKARIRRLSGIEVVSKIDGGFESQIYKYGEDIADPLEKGVWIVEVPDDNGMFQKVSDFYAGRVHAERGLFTLQRQHGDEAWGYEAWEIEITPKLKEAATKGFPLFHKRGKPKTGDKKLDDALDWANDNIGPQGPRSLERLQERINEILRIENKQAKMEQALIDQFAGLKWAIRQTHGHELPAQMSAYKQAHFTTSMDSQMYVFLTHGVPEWQEVTTEAGTGTITGIKEDSQGLLEVLEPVADKIKLWGYWMAARRADRLLKEGREALFTQERVDELLKLGEMFPAFEETAEAYNDWKTQFLDWASEAGVINEDTRALWDTADYVPFYRIKSDEMGGSFAKSAGIGGPGIANVTQPIKRLLESKHPLGDILENIIVNFQHIAMTTMKNKAAQLAVSNLEGSGLITPAPASAFMKKEFIPMDELKKKLKQAGVDWEAMPDEALAGMQQMWTLQRPTGDNYISVLYNGQKKWFEVHEETLLRSLTAINEKKFASVLGRFFMYPFRKIKRLGTTMITLAPDFMAANWFRDIFMAFVNSRHTKMPKPWSAATGAWKAFSKSPEMVAMMAAGGAFYSGYINANDPVSTVKAMKRALRQTGFKNRVLDAPWKLFHLYNDIGAASENANRIGSAYIPAVKAGAGKAEAVWEAKDLMNFAKHGDHAAVQFFAQSVMFLNARIQGLVRYGQRFSEAPGLTFAKSFMYSLAVLMIWLKNKDDDRYKALPDDDKDMYVHFWTNGKHWRLPKSFEVGQIFGTGVERTFEYFYSNEDDAGKVAIDRMWWVIGEMFNVFNRETIVPLPQALAPLYGATTNWNAFFQAPIVPEYMQDIAAVKPEIVYRSGTSPTARELAAGMPKWAPATLRNPLMLEHLMRGYFGTLGSYAMMMSDDLVRKSFDYPARPDLRWNQIAVVKRFYAGEDPPSRTMYEEVVYQVRENARQIERAVNQLEKLEMDDEVDKFLEEPSLYDPTFTNEEIVEAGKAMQSSYAEMKRIRKEMTELWEDEEMGGEQKLRELNQLYRDKLEEAKEGWLERPGASEQQEDIGPGAMIQYESLIDGLIDMEPGKRHGFLVEKGLDNTADLLSSLPSTPSTRMKRIYWENSA